MCHDKYVYVFAAIINSAFIPYVKQKNEGQVITVFDLMKILVANSTDILRIASYL